ncbi:hypothetical protein OSTOST_07776, partial [Ostertagia ostertagi]
MDTCGNNYAGSSWAFSEKIPLRPKPIQLWKNTLMVHLTAAIAAYAFYKVTEQVLVYFHKALAAHHVYLDYFVENRHGHSWCGLHRTRSATKKSVWPQSQLFAEESQLLSTSITFLS